MAYQSCVSCHKDTHEGKFGEDCTKCHTTTDWITIVGNSFDHSKTRYPLRGKHRSLTCDKCHRGKSQIGRLVHDHCSSCHRDIHVGQFADREDAGKCESCHSIDGFSPAQFGISEHEQTKFKLLGAHRAQPCIACHKTVGNDETAYRLYDLKSELCIDCHQDVHFRQFVASDPIKNCQDCHGVDSWRLVEFDHNRNTSYRLTGAHQKVQCMGCHSIQTIDGRESVRYRPLETGCKVCHRIAVTEQELREG